MAVVITRDVCYQHVKPKDFLEYYGRLSPEQQGFYFTDVLNGLDFRYGEYFATHVYSAPRRIFCFIVCCRTSIFLYCEYLAIVYDSDASV